MTVCNYAQNNVPVNLGVRYSSGREQFWKTVWKLHSEISSPSVTTGLGNSRTVSASIVLEIIGPGRNPLRNLPR